MVELAPVAVASDFVRAQVVALASYLPLSGSTFDVEGDGLIPVETALMEGRGKRLKR